MGETIPVEIPNILVVDDTPANLTLLVGMLKEQGYRVRPVPSGPLALQAAAAEPPDLILSGHQHARDGRLRGLPASQS